jgi:hypothetical protein
MGATIHKHTGVLMTLRVNPVAALSVIRKRRNIAAYSRMREELAQTCTPANSDRDAPVRKRCWTGLNFTFQTNRQIKKPLLCLVRKLAKDHNNCRGHSQNISFRR